MRTMTVCRIAVRLPDWSFAVFSVGGYVVVDTMKLRESMYQLHQEPEFESIDIHPDDESVCVQLVRSCSAEQIQKNAEAVFRILMDLAGMPQLSSPRYYSPDGKLIDSFEEPVVTL